MRGLWPAHVVGAWFGAGREKGLPGVPGPASEAPARQVVLAGPSGGSGRHVTEKKARWTAADRAARTTAEAAQSPAVVLYRPSRRYRLLKRLAAVLGWR